MTLIVDSVRLREFRNYASFDLELDPHITVLVAPNATGKTNIIEALQLTTAAESFRKPSWNDVIKWGSDRASVGLEATGDGRSLQVDLEIKGSQRTYKVNGKTKRRVSDVRGTIPAVVFTPDDLSMVKGSAEKRRSSIDSLGDQITPAYEAIRADYEKVLRHRNALLKNPSMPLELLDPWTERLVDIGVAFFGHRRRLFDRLGSYVISAYKELSSDEDLTIEYVPSWGEGEDHRKAFVAALDTALLQERVRGTTLVGPQRDEVVFRIDGNDSRSFASQGQQRSIALAWKLAEIDVLRDILGKEPLLLLDDVMSELDGSRRDALTRLVGGSVQTVMTTTNTGYFSSDLLDDASVVTLG